MATDESLVVVIINNSSGPTISVSKIMDISLGAQKKRLTPTGVICELAKTRSQEHYLYGVQSKAILDLDLTGDDDADTEKRLLAAIELQLVEGPEQFHGDKQSVQQGVAHLNEKIRRLQMMADDVQKYDIKTYRSCVLDVENTITDLHNNNQLRLSRLKCLHMDISAELPAPSALLREETKYVQRRRPPQPSTHAAARTRRMAVVEETAWCDYKEVKEFDRFLRNRGGHTGGWNDEQHSIYLGLRARYRNNMDRIEEAFREILPGKAGQGE